MAVTFNPTKKASVRQFVNNYESADNNTIRNLYGDKIADYADGKAKNITFPMDGFPDDWRVNVIDLLFPVGTKKPSHDKERFKIHFGITDEGKRVDVLSYANKGKDDNAIFYLIENHIINFDFLIEREYAWICEPHCIYVIDL